MWEMTNSINGGFRVHQCCYFFPSKSSTFSTPSSSYLFSILYGLIKYIMRRHSRKHPRHASRRGARKHRIPYRPTGRHFQPSHRLTSRPVGDRKTYIRSLKEREGKMLPYAARCATLLLLLLLLLPEQRTRFMGIECKI